jgi:hypothetical protein
MCHRIRAAMQDEAFQKLTGVVEVDETYIDGKLRHFGGGSISSLCLDPGIFLKEIDNRRVDSVNSFIDLR